MAHDKLNPFPDQQLVWNQESFVINLIKCDLIHCRLLQGFRAMFLESPSYYSLPLYESIIWSLGITNIEHDEKLADWYFEMTEQVKNIEIPDDTDKTSDLANKIFIQLIEKIKKIKTENKTVKKPL